MMFFFDTGKRTDTVIVSVVTYTVRVPTDTGLGHKFRSDTGCLRLRYLETPEPPTCPNRDWK